MQRPVALATIILFSIWILPLGAFIKPSQEKLACDGQRAICLCTHLLAKKAGHNPAKTLHKTAGSPAKEQGGPGGANHDFLSAQHKDPTLIRIYSSLHQESFLYSYLIFPSIEHVPKI